MTSSLFTRRQKRTRFKLTSHAYGRPRLSVFRSGKHIYAQVIDDREQTTLAAHLRPNQQFGTITYIDSGGDSYYHAFQMTVRKRFTSGLLFGLAFAIVLVYLLIVVNFQSWTDPFIMISALPAALAGIAWFLFITHTTLSVPALMGAIMCMGVATSNSILVVSFATEKMTEGRDSISAALEAGFTRFRPVLMTALAMVIGMVPMALGLGDGGEQNAPLGRAVIGGLLFATVSTLFFVPAFFSVLQGSRRHPAQTKHEQ